MSIRGWEQREWSPCTVSGCFALPQGLAPCALSGKLGEAGEGVSGMKTENRWPLCHHSSHHRLAEAFPRNILFFINLTVSNR